MDICRRIEPEWLNSGTEDEPHYVACHLVTQAQSKKEQEVD